MAIITILILGAVIMIAKKWEPTETLDEAIMEMKAQRWADCVQERRNKQEIVKLQKEKLELEIQKQRQELQKHTTHKEEK